MAAETLHAVATRYGVWTQIAKVAETVGVSTLDLSLVPVRFTGRMKRSYGNAKWKTRRDTGEIFDYRIGMADFLRGNRDRLIMTLTHEAAHIIDVMVRGTSDHGPKWQRLHRAMGGDGRARVAASVAATVPSPEKKVVAVCSRCALELKRHKRLPRARTYNHVRCGGVFVPA